MVRLQVAAAVRGGDVVAAAECAQHVQQQRERIAAVGDYNNSVATTVVRVSGLGGGSARLAHGEITGSEDEDAVWQQQQQQQQQSERHRRRPPPPRRVPGVERLLDSDDEDYDEEPPQPQPPHQLRQSSARIADHLSRERDYRDRNHRERDLRQLRDDYVERRQQQQQQHSTSSRQNTVEDYEYEQHRETATATNRPAATTNQTAQPPTANAANNQVKVVVFFITQVKREFKHIIFVPRSLFI